MGSRTYGIVIGMMLACLAGAYTAEAADSASYDRSIRDNSVQMNRMRQYLEQERVNRQIAEDQAARQKPVEQEKEEKEQPQEVVHFFLKNIETNPSDVLSTEEIAALTAPYAGKEVTLQDIYAVVRELNMLYEKKGYATCRAFLPPQKAENGIVHLLLVEGRTGTVAVVNHHSTKESYIRNRLRLAEGDITNTNALNRDLLRFNSTNTTQLRIVMKAGTVPGTTDYEIVAYEPSRRAWTVFEDNTGSDTSGTYRTGIFYQNRSLSGVGDSLGVGMVLSEGTRAANGTYSHGLGRRGTKLNLMYSTNAVKTVEGAYKDMVKGHANAFSIGFSHPLQVNEKKRVEMTLDYTHQKSASDFTVSSTRFNIVNDTIDDVNWGLAMTWYGNSHVFYQKQGYVQGYSRSTPAMRVAEKQHFGFWQWNGLYRKSYGSGRMLSMRGSAQRSHTDGMVSARQFYIGGMYSVRGYKESYLGGDSGFSYTMEYQVPFGKRNTGFLFWDYGQVYGNGQSNNADRILSSAGLGWRSQVGKNYAASLVIGFPFHREFQAETVSPARLHFAVSGQF